MHLPNMTIHVSDSFLALINWIQFDCLSPREALFAVRVNQCMTCGFTISMFSLLFLSFCTANRQSRWGHTVSKWCDFQPRECSSSPDTDTNLWKRAYSNIMAVKSQFLPPRAISHCRKLNCARRSVEESRTQTVRAGRKPPELLSVSGTGGWALVPCGTLQGLKRSSTSTQAAERLEGIHGITSCALAQGSHQERPSHIQYDCIHKHMQHSGSEVQGVSAYCIFYFSEIQGTCSQSGFLWSLMKICAHCTYYILYILVYILLLFYSIVWSILLIVL